MSRHEFIFGAQPAVMKAVAAKNRAERDLSAARLLEAQAIERVRKLRSNLEELGQLFRAEYDNFLGSSVMGEIGSVHRAAYLNSLRQREEVVKSSIADQEEVVRWERHQVARRMSELNRAVDAVRAMESMKERAFAKFRKKRRRIEDRDWEDAALLLFNHQHG